MISRIAKVFNISKATNHHLCEFLAAFHKATPFQGNTQAKIKSKIGVDKSSCSIFSKNSVPYSHHYSGDYDGDYYFLLDLGL